MKLADKLLAVHQRLEADNISHAFGGALLLSYYGEPRETFDLDINISLPSEQHEEALRSLSPLFPPPSDREQMQRDLERAGQLRLNWDETIVDLFFSDVPYSQSIAERVQRVPFRDTEIPVISMEDLIICKAVFNREKDWKDIEGIFHIQGSKIDLNYVKRWVGEFYEPDDIRFEKIEGFVQRFGEGSGPEGAPAMG